MGYIRHEGYFWVCYSTDKVSSKSQYFKDMAVQHLSTRKEIRSVQKGSLHWQTYLFV